MLPFFIAVLIAETAASSERPAADLEMSSMISSLFIRPPRDSDENVFDGRNTPPPGRVVPVDSAKTGLASAHPEAGGHVENRALLIPRLKSDLETGANVASLFAIYSNRKSTVSRVRVLFF